DAEILFLRDFRSYRRSRPILSWPSMCPGHRCLGLSVRFLNSERNLIRARTGGHVGAFDPTLSGSGESREGCAWMSGGIVAVTSLALEARIALGAGVSGICGQGR